MIVSQSIAKFRLPHEKRCCMLRFGLAEQNQEAKLPMIRQERLLKEVVVPPLRDL
ncbi:hypothetical protein [Bacillus sonorensis]|uniref:hypothetical protein n=1 Tax=Bacillus sonorensis TaxID=119858 RepID=UPI001ABF4CD4|nr:hypothetical protein [Bacillus sonorensis]